MCLSGHPIVSDNIEILYRVNLKKRGMIITITPPVQSVRTDTVFLTKPKIISIQKRAAFVKKIDFEH